jgi:hypothetical protein
MPTGPQVSRERLVSMSEAAAGIFGGPSQRLALFAHVARNASEGIHPTIVV